MVANPNALDRTKQVFAYLTGLSDVFSGQHIFYTQASYDALMEIGSEEIALVGLDYSGSAESTMRAYTPILVKHWERGGLVTLLWLPDNPWTGGPCTDTTVDDMADLYTSGNDAYDAWHVAMDLETKFLGELQQAGIVAIWRLFPEMNGTWFWWGEQDHDKFVLLWEYVFDYFTYTKGLNNLIWLYAPYKTPLISGRHRPDYYYPGDDYADLVGIGSYDDDDLEDLPDEGYDELVLLEKPIVLAEFGPFASDQGDNEELHFTYDYTTMLDGIETHCPLFLYFCPWWGSFAIANQNNGETLLGDENVIALDEVVSSWLTGKDAMIKLAEIDPVAGTNLVRLVGADDEEETLTYAAYAAWRTLNPGATLADAADFIRFSVNSVADCYVHITVTDADAPPVISITVEGTA